MNKTVNINLANILFHIDEDAFNKMRRYLESVKRSFANTPGSDEILADIEARIAELFHEKLENERQVITSKEVDEVIAIMGQPEDYMVDEDIFEDEPRAKSPYDQPQRTKKLYRDTEHKYVAGVSSGLAHYVGVDPIWVRLLWVILTIASGGGFILLYGLLWILIPEAATTSQKLDMRGEDINISNIEKKVKEGFDDVTERVKNVDYEKVGNQVKSSGKTFFDSLGNFIMFLFKIFGKFIGIILIIIGASTLIGLFIGLLSVGIADLIHVPGVDVYNLVNSSSIPVWLASLLGFFTIGIPFFFLLYLGLKILVTNLKSIGSVAKFSLLGLWLISLITLVVFGIRQAAAHAYDGSVVNTEEFYVQNPSDTVRIQLVSSDYEDSENIRMNHLSLAYDDNGNEVLLSDDIRFNIKKSKDSIFRIEIRKEANGPSVNEARETAKRINYTYSIEGNTILLSDFLSTDGSNKFRDQEARINLYLPAGTVLNYDYGNSRCWRLKANNDRDMDGCEIAEQAWSVGVDGELKCLECPEKVMDFEENGNKIRINGNGIDININENGEKGKIIINENGIDIDVKDNGESFEMKVDENGVKVKAKDNE